MPALCRDKNPETLETELAHFKRLLKQLLETAEGKFALVKGEKLIGVFDTDQDAYRRGVKLFAEQPFLVRQIRRREPTCECPALHVELVRGNR